MKKFIGICFFIVVSWMVGLMVFDYKINHISVDLSKKTDAVVVLTGGRHRISEAMKLINQGLSNRLFVSGVQKNISVSELEKRHAIKVKKSSEIVLDKVSTNTFENAREVCLWIKKQKIKSIRLVTSNYHLFRSLVEFRRCNQEVEIVSHPVYSEKIATSWWKSFYSFYFLASEYNKFLAAWLRAKFYRA